MVEVLKYCLSNVVFSFEILSLERTNPVSRMSSYVSSFEIPSLERTIIFKIENTLPLSLEYFYPPSRRRRRPRLRRGSIEKKFEIFRKTEKVE